MRRILFLDHTPFVGGAELALLDHIRWLDRDRFEPQVVCSGAVPELVDRFRELGAKTHVLDWPRLRRPGPMSVVRAVAAGRILRQIIRRERIDLVVANTSRTAYIAAAALATSHVPLIWWVRDFDFGQRWFRLLARVPRRIICVSNAIRDYYAGANDAKVAVVFVANDLAERLTAYSPDQVRAARSEFGIQPQDTLVGFMGRLVEGKGPQDLLLAIERLHAEFPRLQLMFVGTGKGQQGDVEEELRRRVTEAGLNHAVLFAGHRTEEALFYQMFDIFVLSSRYREAMPTSVIQAMMTRRPVIATRTGGTPEVVHDNETGILVPPHDPVAIADALRRLLSDPGLAARLASAGHAHATTHHGQSVLTRQVEELYESTMPAARTAERPRPAAPRSEM